MEKKKPVHEIRLGSVRAAIWENEREGETIRYGVTFSRLYKDGEKWKDSSSFGKQELLLLAKVADMTHTFLHRELVEPSDD